MVHILYGGALFENNNNYDNMSIKISKEHGINPSICLCPICRNETGIVLLGKLKGDIKAPKYIIGRDLCDKCKEQINNGKVFFIEANSSSTGEIISFTGRTIIMNKEDAKHILNDNEVAIGHVYIDKNNFERMFGNIINSQKDNENSKTVS